MIPCAKLIPSFLLFCSLFFFSEVKGSKPFPARGFAKILSSSEANERLSRYRKHLLFLSQGNFFHQGYSFQFKLRHMPRRGPEKETFGEITGPALGSGIFRVQLKENSEAENEQSTLLLRNPQKPEAWINTQESKKPRKLSSKELFSPLVDGMNQSPFDLLMPFVFWPEIYRKSGKVAGRPAHLFEFTIPAWVHEERPDWQTIILALDDVYEAPLRIETFEKGLSPIRTITLKSFKKVQGHWIVKSLDCQDNRERSNTRLQILTAAIGLDLSSDLFSVEGFDRSLGIPTTAYQSVD